MGAVRFADATRRPAHRFASRHAHKAAHSVNELFEIVRIEHEPITAFLDQRLGGPGMLTDEQRQTKAGRFVDDCGVGILPCGQHEDIGRSQRFAHGRPAEKTGQFDVRFEAQFREQLTKPSLIAAADQTDSKFAGNLCAKTGRGSQEQVEPLAGNQLAKVGEHDRISGAVRSLSGEVNAAVHRVVGGKSGDRAF